MFSTGAKVLDLGTIGSSAYPRSVAVGLTNGAVITGFAVSSDHLHTHSFIYKNGIMTDFGTLGGDSTLASAIGPYGAVIGESQNASQIYHGFVNGRGGLFDLQRTGLDQLGVVITSARAINSGAGEIVAEGSDNNYYLLMPTPGATTHFAVGAVLNTPPGQAFTVKVTALDDHDTPTGSTDTVAFSSTDNQASVPATATLVGGVATVPNFKLRTVGPQIISVADTSNPVLVGSSAAIRN